MKEYIKSTITVEARRFGVTVISANGATLYRYIILSKEQLRAAQIVGQSSKELISRICERQGLKVEDIDKPERHTFEVDLSELGWC